MMTLTEFFVKLMQITVTVGGILLIFFSYITYSVTVNTNNAEREVIVFGDLLLSSECLAQTYEGSPVKSLFTESKLQVSNAQMVSCLQYPKGEFTVRLLDGSNSWSFIITAASPTPKTATYSVAVFRDLSSREVVPATLVVKI